MRNATVHRGPLAISILLLLFGYPRPWRPHGVCVSLLPLVSAGPDAAAQSVPPASSPLPTASSLEHTTQSKVPDSTSSPELVFGNAGGSDSQQGEKALEVIPDESAQEAVSLPSLGSAYFLGNHVSESLDGTTAPPENVPVLASPLSIVQLHDGSRNSASSFPPEFARGANPRNGSAQSSSPSHDLPFASFSPQKKPDQLFSTSFRSIVKIFIDTTLPDFISPWQMQAPRRSSGSGFVIEGRRILTNGHVVAHQTRILVRKHGKAKKFLATVLSAAHECDLALLGVSSEEFWEDLEPMKFGGIPHLKDSITVLGYPTGGDQLSITEGVVSRIGMSPYVHSSFSLLTVQIDAAINPGNSGGPAMVNDRVVGVAFQGFSQLQNVGFIVPYPVVRHFLNDIAVHRRYTGFPTLGIKAMHMENDSLRQFKGLDKIDPSDLPPGISPTGVLILEVDELRTERHRSGRIKLPFTSRPLAVPPCLTVLPPADDETLPDSEAATKPRSGAGSGGIFHDPSLSPFPAGTALTREGNEEFQRGVAALAWTNREDVLANTLLPGQDAHMVGRAEARRIGQGPQGTLGEESARAEAGFLKTEERNKGSGLPQSFLERRRWSAFKNELGSEASFLQPKVQSPQLRAGGDLIVGRLALLRKRLSRTDLLESVTAFSSRRKAQESPSQHERKGVTVPLDGRDEQGLVPTTDMVSGALSRTVGQGLEDVGASAATGLEGGLPVQPGAGRAAPAFVTEVQGKQLQPVLLAEPPRRADAAEKSQVTTSLPCLRRGSGDETRDGGYQVLAPKYAPRSEEDLMAPNPYFRPEDATREDVGLKPGDVLLAVDGRDIADDGTVPFRQLERVSMEYTIVDRFNGETCRGLVLRDGKLLNITLPLTVPNMRVPSHSWDMRPKYFVFGGLVFTTLTRHLLEQLKPNGVPAIYIERMSRRSFQRSEDDEFVVLTVILASELTVGYNDVPAFVKAVQGRPIRGLAELVKIVTDSREKFLEFTVELTDAKAVPLVLNREKAIAVNPQILEQNNILRDRSAYL